MLCCQFRCLWFDWGLVVALFGVDVQFISKLVAYVLWLNIMCCWWMGQCIWYVVSVQIVLTNVWMRWMGQCSWYIVSVQFILTNVWLWWMGKCSWYIVSVQIVLTNVWMQCTIMCNPFAQYGDALGTNYVCHCAISVLYSHNAITHCHNQLYIVASSFAHCQCTIVDWLKCVHSV